MNKRIKIKNFFYRDVKEFNIVLLLGIGVFLITIAGYTSYALFSQEITSDNTIVVKAGNLYPKDTNSCYTTKLDNTTNTVTITGYDSACGKDVVIPEELPVVASFTLVENPTEEAISNCETALTNNEITETDAQTLCNGGTLEDGTTLENKISLLDGTGMRGAFYSKVIDEMYPVTAIANGSNTTGVFIGKDLTSVVLADTLVTIGQFAFYYNTNLTGDLIIPDSVTTIGSWAFRNNNLTSVTLGNSVETIGAQAFLNNTNLTGALVIPDSVTTIERQAFEYNNLTSVTLGNSVTTIGDDAFSNNNLTGALVIPDSVTSIGEAAFSKNNLTSLTLGNSVQAIGGYAFAFNNLTSLTLGNSVQTIGNSSFSYNNLTSLTLGSSVETIGGAAFLGNNLTSLTIPDSVTTIGGRTFEYNNLNYVYISENSSLIEITGIGTGAFPSSGGYYSISGKEYVNNPGLTVIYNNSRKSFDFTGAITETAGTPFITGTVPSYSSNIVTITTGYPE